MIQCTTQDNVPYTGRTKRKDVFENAQKARIHIHPEHAQSLIRA